MNNHPLVSIVMASYNHADYIRFAIDSVLEQEYDQWELLIADDASDDDTAAVLDAYTGDPRIRIFPFRVNRRFHMRNFACARASGKYVAFLNSDDLFFPGKLTKQIELLEKDAALGAVFTHAQCMDEHNRVLEGHSLSALFATENRPRHQWLRTFWESGNCLCLPSAVVRRDLLDAIGRFNPLLIQISDFDLWVRICLKTSIYVIPEVLTGNRILPHRKNLSAAKPAVFSRLALELQHVYRHYFSDEALLQMHEIFPEMASVAENDLQLRLFLFCQKAIHAPNKHLRLLGFTHLHELLQGEQEREKFDRLNPRVMRNLFINEGTAGLNRDGPGVTWTVGVRHGNEADFRNCGAFWKAAEIDGIICFSLPNPKAECQIQISHPAPFLCCQRFRLYAQTTGTLVYASPVFENHERIKRYSFPRINFASIPSEWIDIEVDTARMPQNAAQKTALFFRKLLRQKPYR